MKPAFLALAFFVWAVPHQPAFSAEEEKKPPSNFAKEARKKSPSFQEKKWTGTQGTSETQVQYDYVGPASQNLGNGQNGRIDEHYVDMYHMFMRHTLLMFLVQGGFEYQHMAFDAPSSAFIPKQLHAINGIVGIDARWSKKDLLHVETHPGFYGDFQGTGWAAFNSPLDIGYTRVVSNRFQWIIGFGLNTWRRSKLLGAVGFRWQINERWRIKAYMPTPTIEYVARPNLTLKLGADIRGDTFRVGPHFGDNRGSPSINSALMNYQEVRVGYITSWNIRPTIALNTMVGYMVGRQYDFHNGGPKLNGSGAPFVSIALLALFKLPGEELRIPQRNRISMRNIFKYF